MTLDLEPYGAYRDSGVNWIGDVPDHWEVAALRRFCRVCTGATPSRAEVSYWKDGSIPWLSSGDVNLRRITKANQFITEAGLAASSTRWIRPGSLVVALAGQGRTKGMVATLECAATCNQSLAAVEPLPGRCDYRFLAYYLESRYLDIRGLVGDGLRDGLNLEHVRSIPAPLPPLDEQALIVRYLDYADRRIRRYLHEKRRLVALLNEHKRSLIHRAVTRGPDPDVHLKPSGVEWLGEVPEHWRLAQLGNLAELTPGFAFKSEGFSENEEDMRLLRGINIAPGRLRWDATVRWPREQCAGFAKYELVEGDIVLGMDRPIISGGVRVAMVTSADAPSLLLQRVARLRCGPDLDADFALCLLAGETFADYLAPVFTGISVPHVSPEQVGAYRLAIPSREEQAAIVARVRASTSALDRSIHMAAQAASLAGEYRTRLVADVVTGKLDVREAVAHLPSEIGEELALDDLESLVEDEESGEGLSETALEEVGHEP